ncbi:hypothetical protein EV122DRAFT_276531 [Schizophyllum commune]
MMRFVATISLAVLAATACALECCPDNSKAEYDYIVVGSGAGGGPVAARLAETGFRVLVVDVGHDVHNYNATTPNYLGRVIEGAHLELGYTLNEYPKNFKYAQDNVWYPRARALGGSTVHNAVVNVVGNLRRDFANFEKMFGSSWSLDNVWEYFKLIERNLYIPNSTEHGYNGWLATKGLDEAILARFPDTMLNNIMTGLLSAATPLIPDINSLSNNDATGVAINPNTIDEHNARSSIYNRLKAVKSAHPDRLHFAFDTLATKIVLCQGEDDTQPKAIAVEVARNVGLPVQPKFHRKKHLKTEKIYAKKEVIVAAGVFQTPQLLMLSGIGDEKELSKFGIDTVVHAPGVGRNLQGQSRHWAFILHIKLDSIDHDEVSTSWVFKNNYTLLNGCTYGSDPATDPCLADYVATHENVYGLGIINLHMPYKSDESLEDPDIDIYWGLTYFPGFRRGVGDLIARTHNGLSAIALRARPSSRGTVSLTGSHPQDELRIFKNRFQSEGGKTDVAALRDAVKRARSIVEGSPYIAPFVDMEAFPGANYTTDDDVVRHVYEHVFGHHACCTAKMGTDDDEYAVLDGDFKVRGVSSLRVVDLSAWPNVPGWFPTTPMYILAEKAAAMIIAEAGAV